MFILTTTSQWGYHMYSVCRIYIYICIYILYIFTYVYILIKWAECSLINRDGLLSSSFVAWSSTAQSVCQRALSLLAIWCLRPRVQILHSAEEDNLSPFDLNIACLCQSIEINKIYIYIYIVYIHICVYIDLGMDRAIMIIFQHLFISVCYMET